MANFDPKPEGMSYAEWLRSKNVGIRVKENINQDSKLPQEYMNTYKKNEIFELNKKRQGGELIPEDIGNG